MKQIFLCLMLAVLAVSCGEKSDTGKAKFKLKLGNIANASASYFPGGLLIAGHRLDDGQSFTLAYTDGLQLELQKGAWEFATIGWTTSAAGPMSGPQQCSYQQVELRDDNQAITFSMTTDNCKNMMTGKGDQFTDSEYYKLTNASGTIGFKKLSLSICTNFDGDGVCNLAYSSSTIGSFKIEIPASLKGISSSSAPAIVSDCVQVTSGFSYSELTPPYGGKSGFLRTDLSLYNSSDCSGSLVKHAFGHGLAEPKPNLVTMAVQYSASAYSLMRYRGEWSGPSAPSDAGYLKGDYLIVRDYNVSALSANIGDTIIHNGTAWTNFYFPATLSNGRPYFDNEAYARLFVGQ